MAVTPFQSSILRLLAKQRRANGETYVAGGVALNHLLNAARKSRDIDLFHDSVEALAATWRIDRALLEDNGYEVHTLREAPAFVEALIQRNEERTAIQWARDSAFRFFPLVQDDLMGFSLHPFDLATNKVLAMAGRLEVRDWVDVLNCDEHLQPFGYLVWAACGKDPGFNPQSLLSTARRLHYSQAEVNTLDFEGTPPDAAVLGQRWHAALEEAGRLCAILPAKELGKCVITAAGQLYHRPASETPGHLDDGTMVFHEGRIKGSWPQITNAPITDTRTIGLP